MVIGAADACCANTDEDFPRSGCWDRDGSQLDTGTGAGFAYSTHGGGQIHGMIVAWCLISVNKIFVYFHRTVGFRTEW